MTDNILEIAAYACLGLGVLLLIARLTGERVARAAGVWRFRRRLRKLDGVPSDWMTAMDAIEDLGDEPPRHPHPSRRRLPGAPEEI